ncbi:MAG: S41 family peptidase [Bacillota bacterium]|nr:S41 family peptidase [Bacillota bacterium]
MWVKRRVSVALACVVGVSLAGLAVLGPSGPGGAQSPGSDGLAAFLTAVQLIRDKAVSPFNERTAWDVLLEALVRALGDPYAEYIPPGEYAGLRDAGVSGIGIMVDVVRGEPTVVAVAAGSSADRAGIVPGDVILEVAGWPAYGLSAGEIERLTRGAAGSQVTLLLRRSSGALSRVTLRRQEMPVQSLRLQILPGDVAYLRISRFEEGTGRDFRGLVEVLRDWGFRRYVLDLRNNPGGLISEAVEAAQAFVPAGVVGFAMDRRGKLEVLRSYSSPWEFNLVVLVDQDTASAAELVAGAIQDRGVGKVVGTRTTGKAAVQNVFPLPNGGALRISVARYLTPNARSIYGTGITPDVVVAGRRPLGDEVQLPLLPTGTTLKYGARGSGVRALQQYLAALGYNPGPIDGVFGPRTQAALVRFQRSEGLSPSGVADAATLAALRRAPFDWPRVRASGQDPQLDRALELLGAR